VKKKTKVVDDKVTFTEEETRRRMISEAHACFGPEGVRQIKLLFQKYDDLLKKCTNSNEIEHIKKIACADLYRLVQYKGGLTINGAVVIPDDEDMNILD
jgi:hypothetical protein